MVPQVKIFIMLLLLFNFSVSGRADIFKDGMELTHSSGHAMLKVGRKLLVSPDELLDYPQPRPNPRHTPPPPPSALGYEFL
ncbi:hypothetical protein FF1_014919 [Malus domestica]